MTKDKKVLYSVSVSIFLLLLVALFIPQGSRAFTALILPFFAVLSCFLIKKRSILSINKASVLWLIAVIGVMCVTLYYLTGLRFGFISSYRLSLSVLTVYIIPTASIIISIEIIRSVMLAQNSKTADVFACLSGILAELAVFSNVGSIGTFNRFMDLVGLTLLPAVIANLVYCYFARRYGVYPNTVYRLITTLYIYFIPYQSAIPDSLLALAKMLIPIIIYAFISSLYENKRRYATKKKSKLRYIPICVSLIFMISIVMLISCRFRFGAIVIATESMTGELDKGDTIVYEEYDGQIITEGQVIVFERSNAKIVHRVVEIERVDGVNRYFTKGDANEDKDAGYITDTEIVGIVELKIPIVGYPTIWLRNIVSDILRGA